MKKLCTIVAMVAILVSGCASLGVWSDAAQKAVDFICKPTEAQMAEAAKWLAAVDSIQAGAAVAYAPLAVVKASAVMTTIKNGGCFIVAEVEAALILIADMQAQQAKLKGIMAPAPAQVQFPVLWATVKGSK